MINLRLTKIGIFFPSSLLSFENWLSLLELNSGHDCVAVVDLFFIVLHFVSALAQQGNEELAISSAVSLPLPSQPASVWEVVTHRARIFSWIVELSCSAIALCVPSCPTKLHEAFDTLVLTFDFISAVFGTCMQQTVDVYGAMQRIRGREKEAWIYLKNHPVQPHSDPLYIAL